jgi:hypothetical protein
MQGTSLYSGCAFDRPVMHVKICAARSSVGRPSRATIPLVEELKVIFSGRESSQDRS